MRVDAVRLGLFMAASLPALALVWLAVSGGLGPNPIREATQFTGLWAIRFLLLALAVTPAARLSGLKAVLRYRRMVGLFAFFYALLHVLTYVAVDQFFDFAVIWKDVVKRPFITIGFAAFAILTALAATSTRRMVRRLGGRAWQKLHRLVYVAGAGAVIHFTMSVKADVTEPLIYGAVLALLLAVRLVPARPAPKLRRPGPGLI